MKETLKCEFCDSFLTTPQQCESCKKSSCLECFCILLYEKKNVLLAVKPTYPKVIQN